MLPKDIIGSPRMFGIETEFFVIDKDGKISDRADEIINATLKKFEYSSITKECGKAMIEHITFPHMSAKASFDSFFKDFETLLYELEKKELGIYN
ncbi:MAG: hypothetical protein AABW92_03395, partial [Nanoarchaeota archaeon]